MKLKDLKPNEKNPRKASKEKIDMLKHSLEIFGSLDGIIFNVRFNRLVGGHQRQIAYKDADIVITHSYKEPTKTGTVNEGYVIINSEKFPYREVDWDEATEKAANIAANKGAGEWLMPELTEMMHDLQKLDFDLNLTMFSFEERKNFLSKEKQEKYSKKIEIPIYEPKGEKPDIKSLFNFEKTNKLITEIEKSDFLKDEEKTFLKYAAYRHIIFNYESIAEYYSHLNKQTQELFENSALVIIDFNKALENGFIELTKNIAETYAE